MRGLETYLLFCHESVSIVPCDFSPGHETAVWDSVQNLMTNIDGPVMTFSPHSPLPLRTNDINFAVPLVFHLAPSKGQD